MDDAAAARGPNSPGRGSPVEVVATAPEATASGVATPPALIFDDVAAELRRFVWGVVRDQAVVDDVIQATYLKAVERGDAARPETAKGWLFRVAYREALVARRRDATRDRFHRRLATLPRRDDPRPDDGLIRSETVRAVRGAIDTLSEAQRRVVLARMQCDRTFAEIAADFGIPLGTVLTHMRRALEKMRQTLDPGD